MVDCNLEEFDAERISNIIKTLNIEVNIDDLKSYKTMKPVLDKMREQNISVIDDKMLFSDAKISFPHWFKVKESFRHQVLYKYFWVMTRIEPLYVLF